MARYAQGKYALAVSDISGQSFPWNEMLTQWNGLFVHYSELETKQPQLNPYPHQADPTALGKVRVQQPAPDALRWLGYNPFQTFAAASGIIIVNQVDHQRTYGETVRFRGPPVVTAEGSGGADSKNLQQFISVPTFDNVSDISAAAGFTITIGKKNSDGSVTTTAGTLGEPENYFYFIFKKISIKKIKITKTLLLLLLLLIPTIFQ